MVFRSDGGACVPELRDEDLARGVDEAAAVGAGGGVVAA